MRRITKVELQPSQYIRTRTRKASIGPWIIYSMSVGKKTYIGRTCHTLERRHKEHIHLLKKGTHNNWMLQELYDQGYEFTLSELAAKDTIEDARMYEDEAIKEIPIVHSLNIRQRRPITTLRPDQYSTHELRSTAVHKVNALLSEGYTLTDATRAVGKDIGFSAGAVNAWCRGVAIYQGIHLQKLKKELT